MKIFNDSNRFTIDWTLNTLCTYHCSYCPPTLHRGTNVFKSKTEDPIIIKEFLINIKKQLAGKSVHIFLNGGEPTISPSLETIIDFCHESNWCLYVNTNGSRSIDWWEEYAHKIYKVTISYHPETVIDEELFKKVEYIRTQTNVGIFTLMYPPLWDKAANAYETFKAMDRVTIAPSRVFERNKGVEAQSSSYEYSNEQLEWLKNNSNVIFKDNIFPPPNDSMYGNTWIDDGNTISKLDEVEFTNNRKNTFLNWKCNMGMDHIMIRPDGIILQSACNQSKQIGTIFDVVQLPKEPTICHTEWCMCTADVMIPKEL